MEELLLDEDYHGMLSPRLHESLVEWLEKKEDAEIAQELSQTIPALVTEQELADIPSAKVPFSCCRMHYIERKTPLHALYILSFKRHTECQTCTTYRVSNAFLYIQ